MNQCYKTKQQSSIALQHHSLLGNLINTHHPKALEISSYTIKFCLHFNTAL